MPDRQPIEAQLDDACSLQDEISMLRDLIQRLVSRSREDHDTKEMLKIVDVASRAAARLGTLVTTQARLTKMREKSSDLPRVLAERIAEFSRRYPARGFEEKHE